MLRLAAPGILTVLATLAGLVFSGCARPSPKLTVGGESTTDQFVTAELLAQQIEARIGQEVLRRTGFTSTPILHQALLMNEVDLYAGPLGGISMNVLKEYPDPDPSIVLERLKSELDRIGRVQIIGLLGYENPFVAVIRTADAKKRNLETLSAAHDVKEGWDIAASSDFLGRNDGNTALQNGYSLVTRTVPRPMDYREKFRMLQEGHIDMVIGTATDGLLNDENTYTVLRDDKKGFYPSQLAVLTRAEVLLKHPELTAAVKELAAKLSTATMRKLDYEVEVRHRQPKDVAADFLAGRLK